MTPNADTSGSGDTVIPYDSWVVAITSVVPVASVVFGILVWYFVQAKRKKTRDYEDKKLSWKPLSLRWPTLLILLGLIAAFVILLESASLAFGRARTADATTSTNHQVHVVVVKTDVVATSFSLRFRAVSSALPSTSDVKMCIQQAGSTSCREPTTSRTRSGGGSTRTGPSSTYSTSTGGWLTEPPKSSFTTTPSTTTGGWLSQTDTPAAHLSWQTEYFIGTFLPTLLASIFAIPWKLLDHDTKTLEPFAYLAHPAGGGTAAQTILLHYDGVPGLVRVVAHAFSTDHVSVTLSTLLKYIAALLSPLAAESVKMGLEGDCLRDYRLSCTGTLRASDSVVRVTQAVLGVMGCVVFAYCLLLGVTWRRTGYGVASDPRNIAAIASLSLNPFLAAVLRSRSVETPDGTFCVKKARKALASTRFQFGHVALSPTEREYAVLVHHNDTATPSTETETEPECESNDKPQATTEDSAQTPNPRRRKVSGLAGQMALFGLFLAGLILMILWYLFYPNTDTGFERFMNSEQFGVRFLFTLFGVLVGFGWGSLFSEIATMMPMWNMARRPTSAKASVLLPLSPNPYVGLITYIRRRQKLLALLSLTTVVSDFLPIFLANVPFSHAITVTTFKACAFLSLGVLCYMLVVLGVMAGAVLLRPGRGATGQLSVDVDVDVKTLGGVLHLACRSGEFQEQLSGLSGGVSGTRVGQRLAVLDSRYAITCGMSEADRGPCITVHG